MTIGTRSHCQSILVASLLWLAMIVCGQQVTQASCGDYLLMDDHAQAASTISESLERTFQSKLATSTLPSKRCHGPGCQQAPTDSFQGIPASVQQRQSDWPIAVSVLTTSLADHGSITGLLAKRVSLSSGFPEGVFRPPVKAFDLSRVFAV